LISKRLLVSALLFAAFTASCHSDNAGNKTNPAGPAAAVQTTTYHAAGVVTSIDVKRPSIEIDHEDIPGLMPAMKMEFYVKDGALLNGLKPGDRIEFNVENGIGGLKITEIKKR